MLLIFHLYKFQIFLIYQIFDHSEQIIFLFLLFHHLRLLRCCHFLLCLLPNHLKVVYNHQNLLFQDVYIQIYLHIHLRSNLYDFSFYYFFYLLMFLIFIHHKHSQIDLFLLYIQIYHHILLLNNLQLLQLFLWNKVFLLFVQNNLIQNLLLLVNLLF